MRDPYEGLPIRDADWCDAELRAGHKIIGERIHLSRLLSNTEGAHVEGCHITADFDLSNCQLFEGHVPEIVAIFDEHGFRPGPRGQH